MAWERTPWHAVQGSYAAISVPHASVMVTGGAFDGSKISSLRGRPRGRGLALTTICDASLGFTAARCRRAGRAAWRPGRTFACAATPAVPVLTAAIVRPVENTTPPGPVITNVTFLPRAPAGPCRGRSCRASPSRRAGTTP